MSAIIIFKSAQSKIAKKRKPAPMQITGRWVQELHAIAASHAGVQAARDVAAWERWQAGGRIGPDPCPAPSGRVVSMSRSERGRLGYEASKKAKVLR